MVSALSRHRLAAFVVALAAPTSDAQTVYRCETAGRVTYSHEPCTNARVVDTTATQGLDRWSGQSRKGQEVRSAEQNKAIAEALKPLLNETPAEREKRHRRFKLAPADRQECSNLDTHLVQREVESGAAAGPAKAAAEEALLKVRKRFRELRC